MGQQYHGQHSSNGEYFDQSHVALPNVSKFFLHQALEERKAAEALMKYQQERGGHYCSKTIQKPNCEYAVGLMKALEVAMVQWKTMIRYFEELYALSIENADPHSASTIKKHFIGPKIRKIKLMGDLLTNLRALSRLNLGRLLQLPYRALFQLAKLWYYYGTTAISCTPYHGPQ
uniref:Ferritin n=1 Tax=Otus sunia TaxID=257818 RepID=A0A8C8ECK0_9STRI